MGIPLDAWQTVTTAIVRCEGCDRIRSFDGDCAHRDINGQPLCRQFGQGFGGLGNDHVEVVLGLNDSKGKGRAFD